MDITVRAECVGNLLRNPGFEEGFYAGHTVGTSLSSHLANEWYPWAVLGDDTKEEPGYNFEPEYKILERAALVDGWYRVLAGEYSMAFFSMYSTHTAGFYQRVPVPQGSWVTFSIWVQIYTGQEDIIIDGRYPVSDLVQPLTEPTRSVKGPGDYRVYVGIEPSGQIPRGFGDPPADSIVWSQPVIDHQTRSHDAEGRPVDEWIQLEISTVAQSDHVTVYTKGQPDFRTKHNDSFWDEACLVAEAAATPTVPPTATLRPTLSPTPRPTASPTAAATVTLRPTLTPAATATATTTPSPTLVPTSTPSPTETPLSSIQLTPTVTFTPHTAPLYELDDDGELILGSHDAVVAGQRTEDRDGWGLAFLYLLNGVLIALVVYWIRLDRQG